MGDGVGWVTTGRKRISGEQRRAESIAPTTASGRVFSSQGRDVRLATAPAADGTAYVQRLAVAELAEGIAHDLKNQLTVVAASVQLARGVADGGQHDLLERAWRAAMRAAQLMDEMLRYTHGGFGTGVDADAAEALETAVAGAWGYCSARGVQLEMRLGESLPRVVGSAPALRVLLLHLLRWVADRCPPDGRLVAEACPEDGGVGIHMRLLDGEGHECHLGARVAGTADAGAGIEVAVLQALAGQAGVRLVEEGVHPVLLLQGSPDAARGREDGPGGGRPMDGLGAGELGRGGEA